MIIGRPSCRTAGHTGFADLVTCGGANQQIFHGVSIAILSFSFLQLFFHALLTCCSFSPSLLPELGVDDYWFLSTNSSVTPEGFEVPQIQCISSAEECSHLVVSSARCTLTYSPRHGLSPFPFPLSVINRFLPLRS